ncbi:hypothetical protein MTO96_009924 [Rhipicephalus appendiculatus]
MFLGRLLPIAKPRVPTATLHIGWGRTRTAGGGTRLRPNEPQPRALLTLSRQPRCHARRRSLARVAGRLIHGSMTTSQPRSPGFLFGGPLPTASQWCGDATVRHKETRERKRCVGGIWGEEMARCELGSEGFADGAQGTANIAGFRDHHSGPVLLLH